MAWWLQGDLQPFAHFRSGMGRSPGGAARRAPRARPPPPAAAAALPPAGRLGCALF